MQVRAIDELASLVRGFNEMTQELEANSRELEARRRFTEAILESIPTGVISIGADGCIQRVNRALCGMFPAEQVAARHPPGRSVLARGYRRDPIPDEARPPHRRRPRARWSCSTERQTLHLAVTVSALEEKLHFRLRDRARRYQRTAARAEGRRLA